MPMGARLLPVPVFPVLLDPGFAGILCRAIYGNGISAAKMFFSSCLLERERLKNVETYMEQIIHGRLFSCTVIK